MKNIVIRVASLGLAAGAVLLAGNQSSLQARVPHSRSFAAQEQAQPQSKVFTGTIAKNGDQFVLREDSSRSMFQLDDQQSAGKFVGKRVNVTGVLDASNNIIRVQSIEEAKA
jgi:Protein of unknown function (DUF5818)